MKHYIYLNRLNAYLIFFYFSHLREKHCTREGGSFVCRYGDNGVCNSLPVEGVSDADYEHHVYKNHAYPLGVKLGNRLRKLSLNSMAKAEQQQTTEEKWTVYTTAQNLPAVLNDPSIGKQVSCWFCDNSCE